MDAGRLAMRGDDVVASLAYRSALTVTPTSTPVAPSLSFSLVLIFYYTMLSRRLVLIARGRALRADAALLSKGW